MRRRLVFLTLLALHVGLRLAVWLRPVRELDDLVLPDDAYLSLHLARSIAHGLGLPASSTRWDGADGYTNRVVAYDAFSRPTKTAVDIPAKEDALKWVMSRLEVRVTTDQEAGETVT